jgi:sugar (glycoside-pentoside-hexuronide) transporter
MAEGEMMEKNLTGGGERLGYGAYFIGQNVFYWLITMFLVPFFTDAGIPAITVAGLALVIKAWDAVNDPIFGGLVDKVRFKKGKFLPWLRISLIFIPLSTILIFAIPPSFSLTGKVIWAGIAYILWDTAYTICDVPAFGLVTTMTASLRERTTLITIGRIAAGAGYLGVTMVVPLVRRSIGGWLPTSIVLSGAALLFMAPLCFLAKERIQPRTEAQAEVSIRDMLRFLRGNKYMFIFFGAMILSRALDVGSTLNLYYARYNLGDESLLGIVSLLGAAPTLVTMVITPALCRRMDKFTLYWWSTIAAASLAVVSWFAGYHSFPVVVVMSLLRSIPLGFLGVLMFMFTPDCVEYGAYKTGVNASGIAFALQTFSSKMLAALAASAGALMLTLIGFAEGEGAVQNGDFPDKLWFIFILLPAVGNILTLPLLWQYKLRDRDVAVMARYNSGEITRDEAESLLDGRP